MKFQEIKRKINESSRSPLGVNEFYSVLLPIIKLNNKLQILFQIRADDLSTQPGEISLPGGKIENNEHRAQAAMRETREELGLNVENIELLGELDFLVTPYNLIIYSYAGYLEINSLKEINFNTREVKDIFTVPLQFFKENSPQNYPLRVYKEPVNKFPYYLIPGGRDYNWREGCFPVYFYSYQDHVIWGFTAKIIKAFIELVY